MASRVRREPITGAGKDGSPNAIVVSCVTRAPSTIPLSIAVDFCCPPYPSPIVKSITRSQACDAGMSICTRSVHTLLIEQFEVLPGIRNVSGELQFEEMREARELSCPRLSCFATVAARELRT
jgi:hypothetical protein